MASKRGRQQFQFTGLEMAALGASFLATATMVFLLGFWVGQKNAAEHGGLSERVARIPIGEAARYKPGGEAVAGAEAGPGAEPAKTPAASAEAAAPPKAAAKPAKPAEVAAEPAEPEAAEASKAAYSVQVLATRRQADAEALVRSLRSSGLDAYLKSVDDGGNSWYRVRVGRFSGLAEARAMAERCRKELGLDQAYVSTY